MTFPKQRLRRLRASDNIRKMIRETSLSISDLIYPMFIIYGEDKKIEVPSMPGVFQLSLDRLRAEVLEVNNLGIPAVLLFGIPEKKDAIGSSAYASNGIIQEAIKVIKDTCPDLLVISDVCLCEYTDHGHCGLLTPNGKVDNDKTLELLARQAISHAQMGADIIAPSDMMDGRIGYIRTSLDEENLSDIAIMSYAAKYSSSFYGPFRDAAGSAPQFGDRKSYQMDSANIQEALREVALDIEEGADIIMVKPALAYLDVIHAVKNEFKYPTAAYNVSGEYAMVKAAAKLGWLDEEKITYEILQAIKRAGADMIITYAAKDIAHLL